VTIKISIVVSYSNHGGVEVVTTNLLNALARAGAQIELVLIKDKSHLLASLDSSIKVRKLKRSSAWLALPELVSYLKSTHSDVVVAIKDRAAQVVAVAAHLANFSGPVVGHVHNNMLVGLENRPQISRTIRYAIMSKTYQRLTRVFGVSQDTVNALKTITGLPENHFKVMPNVIITQHLSQLASVAPTHPWLVNKQGRVLVGSGRLTPQKNFTLLIEAFALVSQQAPDIRLIIFGDGGLRETLEALVHALKLVEKVNLAGFYENPYPEIKCADMFVLSSEWEGSPTVLSESLALHTPVVSTDVGDARETLARGALGEVVPCGCPKALANAILQQLGSLPTEASMDSAIDRFKEENAAAHYLRELEQRLKPESP